MFADPVIGIGNWFWQKGDSALIDGVLIDGSANRIGRIAGTLRRLQTGYLYHYAFAMIIGLICMIGYWVLHAG